MPRHALTHTKALQKVLNLTKKESEKKNVFSILSTLTSIHLVKQCSSITIPSQKMVGSFFSKNSPYSTCDLIIVCKIVTTQVGFQFRKKEVR